MPALAEMMAGGTPRRFADIHGMIDEFDRVLTTPGHYAYLRIAEGCDNRCAYCVIPSLRGRYRSRRMEDVLAEAKKLADAGVKECIVIAQDITRYGIDLYGEKKLAALLRELVRSTRPGIRSRSSRNSASSSARASSGSASCTPTRSGSPMRSLPP